MELTTLADPGLQSQPGTGDYLSLAVELSQTLASHREGVVSTRLRARYQPS